MDLWLDIQDAEAALATEVLNRSFRLGNARVVRMPNPPSEDLPLFRQGTIVLLAAKPGSQQLNDICEAAAAGDERRLRDMGDALSWRALKAFADEVVGLKDVPAIIDVRYRSRTVARGMMPFEPLEVAEATAVWNGGDLADDQFHFAEYVNDPERPVSDVAVILVPPRLSELEEAIVREIPSELSEVHISGAAAAWTPVAVRVLTPVVTAVATDFVRDATRAVTRRAADWVQRHLQGEQRDQRLMDDRDIRTGAGDLRAQEGGDERAQRDQQQQYAPRQQGDQRAQRDQQQQGPQRDQRAQRDQQQQYAPQQQQQQYAPRQQQQQYAPQQQQQQHAPQQQQQAQQRDVQDRQREQQAAQQQAAQPRAAQQQQAAHAQQQAAQQQAAQQRAAQQQAGQGYAVQQQVGHNVQQQQQQQQVGQHVQQQQQQQVRDGQHVQQQQQQQQDGRQQQQQQQGDRFQFRGRPFDPAEYLERLRETNFEGLDATASAGRLLALREELLSAGLP